MTRPAYWIDHVAVILSIVIVFSMLTGYDQRIMKQATPQAQGTSVPPSFHQITQE